MARGRIIAFAATAFMLFWLFGMATSLASGACRKGLSTAERTNRACSVSKLGLTAVYRIGQPYKSSDAVLYVGYGVVAFAKGDKAAGRALFETSYARAQLGSDRLSIDTTDIPRDLVTAMARLYHEQVPTEARDLWWAGLADKDPALAQALALYVDQTVRGADS